MKVISMILSLCFAMNVFAAANLEDVFNDYQYALTVEWDQKDQAFMEKETKLFYENLKALNVSSEDMMNLVETKIPNTTALNQLKMEASLASSTEELVSILNHHSPVLYNRGASWNGRTVLTGAAIVGVSALFIYSIYFNIAYGGCIETTGGQRTPCNELSN